MTKLLLTDALEPPGPNSWRVCGKLWVASLLRHLWDGTIRVGVNFERPLFSVARVGVDEVMAAARPLVSKDHGIWKAEARRLRLAALAEMEEAAEFEWVLLADADCVALRNLDHLFPGDADLLVSRLTVSAARDETPGGWKPRERPAAGSHSHSLSHGPDPGFVAVRGGLAVEFARHLQTGGGLTCAALSALIENCGWRVREFERGEVLRPSDPGVTLEDLAAAAVVHFSGMDVRAKRRLMFAFHMMAVYGDEDGLFFEMLES